MPSDISRTSDEQRYTGVVMQQGRVILDRDINALRETIDRRIDDDALDFVGPNGTPDDGFEIGAAGAAGAASPPYWSPPEALSSPPGSNPYDFSISAGTMYVGGQRAVFAPQVPGQGAVEYSYFDQPEWISPPAPPTPLTQEFIYLHLLEHTVSAVEDPELKDVALGGPDTTQRLQVVKRVKRLAVTSADCATARAQAAGDWQLQGLKFDPKTMRLIPQATLVVSYADPTTANNPCDPAVQGGYLGADNQLIRVQISDGGIAGGTPLLLWGFDNASFLYRATASSQTPTTLILAQSPVDAYHIPQQEQVIEVLRSSFIIDTEPNAGDPQQPSTVRCVAETRGFICTLAAPYAPDTRTLALNQQLPAEYLDDTNPLFVRIWQSQIASFTPDGSTSYSLQNLDGTQTGVQVTIGVSPAGGPLPIGAYWMFAVRPSTPQAVYPERFLVSPQPPDGPRQWVCPLATIDWTGQSGAAASGADTSNSSTFNTIQFTIVTGSDDLRPDSTATATLEGADGSLLQVVTLKAQTGAAWGNGSTNTVNAALNPPLAAPDIGSIDITLTSHNAFGETDDNWNINSVSVSLSNNGAETQPIVSLSGNPLVRLTGSLPSITISPSASLPAPQSGPVFHDCRNMFCNLVELSKRRLGGCCAVTIHPQDLAANPAALQNAADQFLGAAAGMAICLTPGTFTLSQPLQLNSGHNGLCIEACHGAVSLQASGEATAATFLQGLIVLAGADDITLKGILFIPPAVELAAALPPTTDPAGMEIRTIVKDLGNPRMLIGVRLQDCARLQVIACEFQLNPTLGVGNFGAGLFASGNCTGLSVRQSQFSGPPRTQSSSVTTRIGQTSRAVQKKAAPKRAAAAAQTANILFDAERALPAMLAAFLMVPFIEPPIKRTGNKLPTKARIAAAAALDQAEFIDNSMQGLTVAVLAATAAGAVKFANNTVSDCVGGIWFAGLDPTSYPDAATFESMLFDDVPQGASAGDAMALTIYYPLPQAAAANVAPGTLSPELHLVNNRIDAVPADGSASGPACLLYLSPASVAENNASGPSFDATILLNSNQLRNSCGTGIAEAEVDTITAVTAETTAERSFLIDQQSSGLVVSFPTNPKITTTPSVVASGLLKAWNASAVASALASATADVSLVLTANTPGYPMGLSTSVSPAGNDQLNLLVSTPAVPGYGATAYLSAAANIIVNGNLMHNLQWPYDGTPLQPNSFYVGPATATIAVAGNMFLGASNLAAPRTDIPALTSASLTAVPQLANLVTWKFLNHANP
ncbi:MAG: DUF6519 domain-containing protein [Steroidobacteraceae bacterium]